MNKESGQILATIMMLMAIFLVFVPSYVYFTSFEAKSTVSEKKRTTAFHLAESGIDRGYWKLKERSEYWAQLGSGTPIAGYNNDVVYADIPSATNPSGEYVIRISSHPTNTKYRVIRASGRDKSTNQVRTIETIFACQSIDSAIFGDSNVTIQGHATVHWGQIWSQQSITASGDLFPRKYSKQNMINRDANGPTPPNTDGIEWWSYYNVPDRANIDFTKYKTSATANGTYYPAVNNNLNSVNDTRNLYWYFDHNVRFTGNIYLYGTVIVRENFEMMGTGNGTYTTAIPSEAWREYQKIDTAAANQNPGDTGLKSNAATYTFSNATTRIKIRGFLFVGGTATFTGNSSLHGAAVIVGNIAGAGSCEIYYDDTLQIEVLTAAITRKSWQEVRGQWPL